MKIITFLLLLSVSLQGQSNFEKAEIFYTQEKFNKAKPLFEAYLKQNPNNTKTREYLGDIAGYTKQWDIAITYFKNLVKDNPKNATFHFKYGGVLGMKALSVNKLRGAFYISEIKEHFLKAANLDPNHIEVRWALVEFYIQLPGIIGGSEEKAIQFANELAKISPVDGFLANGYIAEYNDRPKDAERFYKQAIAVGGSPHTYEKLSSHYEKNNMPKKAIETAKKSLDIHKRNSLNYQIGKVSAQYNLDAKLGLACLQAYVANHTVKDGVPKDWAYYRIAQIYKNIGNKVQALTWIEKALQSRPDFKEANAEKKLIEAL